MFPRGAVRLRSSIHLSYAARAADKQPNGGDTTRASLRLVNLLASPSRFPLTGKRQAMCASCGPAGFSSASSVRGGCSTGASLQSRSRTLTPARRNSSPASPARVLIASCPTDFPRLRCRPTRRPTSVSKSPGETPPNSAVGVPKSSIPSADRQTPLTRSAAGEMRSCTF
jgi:hypothetical protein